MSSLRPRISPAELLYAFIIGAALVVAATHGSAASGPIPATLSPPADEALALEARATGVQIYTCAPSKGDATRFEWTFKSPEATLADPAGRVIGKHYAGPTWESNDGSRVAGATVAHEDSPDPHAIAWLLLKAKANSGDGVFGATRSVQRVNTAGGIAPSGGCSAEGVGREVRVPYTATYLFYAVRM